jgi:hypothetical protein
MAPVPCFSCDDRDVIREFQLSTAHQDEDVIYEPPTGILRVSVIGDKAWLDWEEQLDDQGQPSDRQLKRASFQVEARSLMIALRAAWEDGHPGSSSIDDRTRGS